MMKKQTLRFDEIEQIRNFAKEICTSPYLVGLIAYLLYDIAKRGQQNEFPQSSIDSVSDLNVEDEKEIPIQILVFLKNNVTKKRGNRLIGGKQMRLTRIHLFIEEIRKNVLQIIKNSDEYISCEDLAKYSQIFNMKYIKSHFSHAETSNEVRFIIAVGLGQNDYSRFLDCSQEYIDIIYDFFEDSSPLQLKDLIETYKFIYI